MIIAWMFAAIRASFSWLSWKLASCMASINIVMVVAAVTNRSTKLATALEVVNTVIEDTHWHTNRLPRHQNPRHCTVIVLLGELRRWAHQAHQSALVQGRRKSSSPLEDERWKEQSSPSGQCLHSELFSMISCSRSSLLKNLSNKLCHCCCHPYSFWIIKVCSHSTLL